MLSGPRTSLFNMLSGSSIIAAPKLVTDVCQAHSNVIELLGAADRIAASADSHTQLEISVAKSKVKFDRPLTAHNRTVN